MWALRECIKKRREEGGEGERKKGAKIKITQKRLIMSSKEEKEDKYRSKRECMRVLVILFSFLPSSVCFL